MARREAQRAPRPPARFRLFTMMLGLAVALLLPAAVTAAAQRPLATLGWTALLTLASWRAIWAIPRLQIEVTLGAPVAIGAAVVVEPSLALLIGLLAITSEHEIQMLHRPWMVAFNHLQIGLVTFATSVVAHQVVPDPVAGALIGAPLHVGLSSLVVAAAAWLLGRTAFRDILRTAFAPSGPFTMNFLLIALLSVLVVLLETDVGSWSLAILVVPMMLGFSALQSARQASERADELAVRLREVEVCNALGSALLSACSPPLVAELGTGALRTICGEDSGALVVLDEDLPTGLEQHPVPGAAAVAGVPPGLDERRLAVVGTICTSVGLALQRLAVEERLRESQRAQAELAEQILAEGAIARSRVALHVHDDVLPFLAAAQIQADNTLSAAETRNVLLTTQLAGKVRDAVQDGIRTLREVLDDLQSQTLLPGDLPSWVARVGEQLRLEHGLDVAVDVGRLRDGIAHPVELLLAETITGLVANVLAHAQASSVRIRLHSTPRYAVLDLRDDGVGFDPDAVGQTSHGLALLRQRAALVDGRLTIASGQGEGTHAHLHVPVAGIGPAVLPRPLPAPERVPA